jgi:hypothetical protein
VIREWPAPARPLNIGPLSSGASSLSAPHLRALEDALARRGWRVAAVHPGDDYRVSARWELHRSGSNPILIDFDGLGPEGDHCLPLDESYGCQVRRDASASLYFRRVNRSRELWQRELAEFVQKLDAQQK